MNSKIKALIILSGSFLSIVIYQIYLNSYLNQPTFYWHCQEWGSFPNEHISTAQTNLNINNRIYYLETQLIRDFMPTVKPHPWDYALMGFISIIANDSLYFPIFLDADRIWIIKSNETISTTFVDNYKKDLAEPNILYKFICGGQIGKLIFMLMLLFN